MNVNDIVASRQYSWVYEADAATVAQNTNKGGRAGVAPNPLYGQVSTRKVYAGQAATAEMLLRAQLALDPSYKPSAERAPTFEATSNPAVVRSLSSGGLQVRIMRPRTIKVEYFVNGQPATSEQLKVIRQYARKRSVTLNRVRVMFPYVDNLANVEGELTEVAED